MKGICRFDYLNLCGTIHIRLQECELNVSNDSLTCLSLLILPYALHVRVDGNNSHVVESVGIQVPQDGGGGAS